MVLKFIEKYKVVPVVVIEDIEKTIPTLQSLIDGNLPIAEITFRTSCAADAISLAVKTFPDMLIGAGTVINAKQCKQAINSGAKFIVSPGFSDKVLKVCKSKGVPYLPGCATPTEIMQAVNSKLSIVKFFPAQVYGGLSAINALGAAFPSVKFLPTGGVNGENILEFLKNPKIFAVGGSFMMKKSFVETKDTTFKVMQTIKENII